MRYMLLLYSESIDVERDEEERLATMAAYDAFTAEVQGRGAFLGANPLEPVSKATSVRVRGGEALVTDGPFAETREQLGGYYLVDCPDLDAALELAAKCPAAANGTVEVRPVMELPGLHHDATASEGRPAG
jgi:hypothetical protein